MVRHAPSDGLAEAGQQLATAGGGSTSAVVKIVTQVTRLRRSMAHDIRVL
jgi:hypothetical protein